ncbi:MAG: RecQ family ATP-dependent DNA helicase [Prevotella sp.]|nr:RecQ family ATP-dependent DNA helicase [Prevotella sp.]
MTVTSKDFDTAENGGQELPAIESNPHSQCSTPYSQILKQYWGYDDFRGIQREIIESIGAGRDTLGLMPTGGGKSIAFQVPALAMEGVCLCVTPLIALMKDQVLHLRQRGIFAAAIHSGMSHDDILRALENCIFGKTKVLYISPERLASELFQTKLRHINVSFIAVDEAHCISQWGYDFRPSYLEIARIRQLKPDCPILALTATATPRVVDDIQEQLQFKEKNVFRMSFERANLAYVVRRTADKRGELKHILNSVGGSAIVYVRSRKRSKEAAGELCEAGIKATFYHAGLDNDVKDERQRQWQQDEVRVIVATNAFGMGIDKPDVRVVVHLDCPDSIEAYFQEAGRAGRDGRKAYAVLLYNDADEHKLRKRISDTFPEKEYIYRVYEHIAYYYQMAVGDGYGFTREFNIDDFCHQYRHFPIQVNSALHILQRAGYLEYDEDPDSRARVMFLTGRDELYRLEHLPADEDSVIVSLLRNYGGLFADYCYIDESLIARQAGLTAQQTYLALKSLAQKRILSFIPRRNVPFIRYSQRREETRHLWLPTAVYEERRDQYAARIEAMIRYAQTDDQCRSRQLLRYFGETRSTDCGQCDVCLSEHDGTMVAEDRLAAAKLRIQELLADGERHHVTELLSLQLPTDQLDAALQYLLAEEFVWQEDGYLFLA